MTNSLKPKISLADTIDMVIRGFMPEIGDGLKQIIREPGVPPWLKTRTAARGAFILAQFVERGWKGSRIAEAISDVIESTAREMQNAYGSRPQQDQAHQLTRVDFLRGRR